ncbi:MAG: MFS transporter [Nitrospinota bacterium]|nr:MFS transporter [Nitrospinota bacterium]
MKKTFFYYGWTIISLIFFCMAYSVAVRFSFSIFQTSLIEEFGWGRGVLGSAYAVMLGIYAITCPFTGRLFDRKGPRFVLLWGPIFYGVGMLLSSLISELWHVFVFPSLLVGLGIAMSGFPIYSALIPKWFDKKRGMATGIALSGSGIGMLFLIPLIEYSISSFGWRLTYLILGFSVLFFLFPIVYFFLYNKPEDVGQEIDGIESPNVLKEKGSEEEKKEHLGFLEIYKQLKGNRNFWVLAITVFLIGLNNNMIFSQLHLYLTDVKFSSSSSALIFGAVGFVRIVGSIIMGWCSDYIGRPYAQSLSAFLTGVGILVLMCFVFIGNSVYLAFLYILIFGIGLGGMTSCYSAMAADSFKGGSFGAIMGFLEIFFGLGGVLGPPFAGFVFDFTGSYLFPFMTIVVGMVVVVFFTLVIYKDPNKVTS